MDAENQLNITQNNLQKTLLQLSSGQRINSGADDAAGWAIANGLEANITALNQSVQNVQTALTMINSAIASVASMRGTIGADINRLRAASNVATVQTRNLTSAEDGIMAADIPTAVSNLSQYMILDQSGISALAQVNSAQQSILKLLA